MSFGSRLAIGIVAIFGAIGFLKTALNPVGVRAPSIVFHGMAALFTFVAIACFVPKSRPVTLRIIGSAIFFAFSSYVISSFGTDNFGRALKAFGWWGPPSGYLAILGNYPSWGKGAAGINAKNRHRK
ncbi:hypothetical protein [Chamaesiphon sp. VAR_48_metabat_403]|uniref:hypothetical protein n=1 Tax=Chamaesiphon sp. VAR_48_metabat_403 TaxID=2964700 RepID=UPI00286E3B55|nr:hypothetical protein [Chamaesiphon sp. VAR_48_metabat_403]